MKVVLMALFLLSFSSCVVVKAILGANDCAQKGCDREAEENSNYCAFHASYHLTPEFNRKAGQAIDQQVRKNTSDFPKKDMRPTQKEW